MPGVSLLRGLLPFFCVFFRAVFFFLAIVIYSFRSTGPSSGGSEALNGYIKKADRLSTTDTDRAERCANRTVVCPSRPQIRMFLT